MNTNTALKLIQSSPENDLWIYKAKLDEILQLLQEEIRSKQQTISRQEEELIRLRNIIDERNTALKVANSTLNECHRHTEGNKQLINKLLNDLRQVQNDLEWYKRTYEKRSLMGILKERMKIALTSSR